MSVLRAGADISAVIDELDAKGLKLWVEGRQLRFRGPRNVLTPEYRQLIVDARSDVMLELRNRAAGRTALAELSPVQRLILEDEAAGRGWPVHALAVSSDEAFDFDALRQALQAVVDRHAMLRLRVTRENGTPMQVINGNVAADLGRLAEDAALDANELRELVDAHRALAFEHCSGPPWRMTLFGSVAGPQVLLFSVHPLAADSASFEQLVEELRQFYAEATGVPCRLPDPCDSQYLQSLAGDTVDRSVSAPASSVRSAVAGVAVSPEYCVCQEEIPAPLWHEIARRAREMQLPPAAWLLAAFIRLIKRAGAGGPNDLSVSLPGGRSGRFARTVGPFHEAAIVPADGFSSDTALDEAARAVAVLLSANASNVSTYPETAYRVELRDAQSTSPDLDRFLHGVDPERVLGFGRLSLRPWPPGATSPRPRLCLRITQDEANAACCWIAEKPTYTPEALTKLAHDFREALDAPSTHTPSLAASADVARDSASDLLERLQKRGARLWLEQGRLRVNAPQGVLDEPVKAEIARYRDTLIRLVGRDTNTESGLERVDRSNQLPLSHAQQRLWFMRQLDPGSFAYNVPVALRMKGKLDVAALERTLQDLVQRHESLRTRFLSVEGAPHCRIEPFAGVAIDRIDLTRLAPLAREEAAMRECLRISQQTFDLSKAPLLHPLLIKLSDDEHIFVSVFDHIVTDGLSLGIFTVEFRALYARHAGGNPERLPELPFQYADYVEYERGASERGVRSKNLVFWKQYLSGAPSLLQLPTDRPRPAVQTSRGARILLKMPGALGSRLKTLARKENATLFMLLMAGFQALLHRYSGETDIVVGTAVANRNRLEFERVMGFFANNIVLRGDLAGDPSARELIARVRASALKAYAHQDMPFDVLVEVLATRRELDHPPLMQVMLVLQDTVFTHFEMSGLACEAMELPLHAARLDLAVDVFDLPDGLNVYFEYNTDLFDAATINRMQGHFQRLLEDLVERPDTRISELVMLSPAERNGLLLVSNRVDISRHKDVTVHGLFEAQVARSPGATAVVFNGDEISYIELNARANQLAHHLRGLGVGRESLVGVWMDRSTEMIVALLGVLKAGGAYVPLDPAFPQDRIKFMMADADLEVIVTESRLAQTLPADGPRAVCLDSDAAPLARHSVENPTSAGEPHDLAYVIYTSGSTGRPKGVMLEHRSVVNFLLSMHREPGISASDRVVAVTTLSFDIAGLEIFGLLTAGGAIAIAPRETALDGVRLAELLESSKATLFQATPATWRLLIETGWRGRENMKMLCGGEALPRDLAGKLLGFGGELWNMYGPTETTIWSTLWKVTDTNRAISIGRPIANTQVYVLDSSGQPAPIGVAGELYISGDGLARGYRNRDDLTSEKFVTLVLPTIGATRAYRTGDMVRFLDDGRLEFVGRRDHQVKVRGFRIELGEIENVLAAHPGIKENVVHVLEDSPGDQRLVAYVVPITGVGFDSDAARRTLRAQLPEYMVPNMFVALDSLPLTPNGKVDRKALPAATPVATEVRNTTEETVMTPVQRRVAHLWQSILKINHVTLHENFFDLGGHSLLLVKLQSALEREFGCELQLVELFQRTTVAAQAERLERPSTSDGALKRAQARAMKQVQSYG